MKDPLHRAAAEINRLTQMHDDCVAALDKTLTDCVQLREENLHLRDILNRIRTLVDTSFE